MAQNVSRRTFLAIGGGGLSAAFLAACASGTTPAATTSTSRQRPGPRSAVGTLRVGSIGSTADIIDTTFSSTDIDQQRNQNVYDSLKYISADLPYQTEYALAESIELNAAATMATVRLRQGVEFHNGKSLTADDLIFTMRRILDPNQPGKAATSFAAVDPGNLKKLDALTVQFNLQVARLAVRPAVGVGIDEHRAHGLQPRQARRHWTVQGAELHAWLAQRHGPQPQLLDVRVSHTWTRSTSSTFPTTPPG